MTIPHVPSNPDGIAYASEQNALIDQSNTNTDDIATNASDISTNASGISTNSGRLDTLEAAYTSYDHALYGDKLSSCSRREATATETTSATDGTNDGYLTAFGIIAPHTVTVSEVRMYLFGAAASTDGSTGTFDIGFYRGGSLSNMPQVASDFGSSYLTSSGLLTLTFSSVTIQAGEAIGIEVIATDWETDPTWLTTPAAAYPAFVNAQNHSVYQSGQSYPLDDPLNLEDSKWTTANKMFWFALA